MSWAVGFDGKWNRDIGYGVPALCDHPDCTQQINRGLSYVCGSKPYGGDHGCGLFFCERHRMMSEHAELCERCAECADPFEPKPDVEKWIDWKLAHESWKRWRDENPDEVASLRARRHGHVLMRSQELKGESLAWAAAAVYQMPAAIFDGCVHVEAEPGRWLRFDPWDMLRSLVLGHVASVEIPLELALPKQEQQAGPPPGDRFFPINDLHG